MNQRPPPLSTRRGRRAHRDGAVMIVLALGLVALLGAAAMVIDLGHLRNTQTELQAVADAASHAGVLTLDGTDDGLMAARQAAMDLAAMNQAGGEAVALGRHEDIELGEWDLNVRTFTPSSDAEAVNAVRVLAAMRGMRTWFAQAAFGTTTMGASAEAVAMRTLEGASRTDCFIPIALPSCIIDDLYGMDGVNMVDLVLNPPSVDNVGWAMPAGNPNADWLMSMFQDCESAGHVGVGDVVGLNNGVINSALMAVADAIEASDTRWDPALWGALPEQAPRSGISSSLYGNTYEGVVMLFDDDSYCQGGGSFTGSVELTGLVWGAIYDVSTSGPVIERTIRMRLETLTDHDAGNAGGGPDYRVQAVRTRLVR